MTAMDFSTRVVRKNQWCSHRVGQSAPLSAKNVPKIRKKGGGRNWENEGEKEEKEKKKEEKSGRKGKNLEGTFILPLLTDYKG